VVAARQHRGPPSGLGDAISKPAHTYVDRHSDQVHLSGGRPKTARLMGVGNANPAGGGASNGV
jgi:hypothetical protein